MKIRNLSILIFVLVIAFAMTSITFSYLPGPVLASEPTPTPIPDGLPDSPSDALCHLANGKDCTFINPLDIAAAGAKSRIHPAVGAQHVPTYTLVSVRFNTDIDVNTLSAATFNLRNHSNLIEGAVNYISAAKMAVFYPAQPLTPDTTYTATIINIKDALGRPVALTNVWTFTTASSFADSVNSTGISIAAGMNVYFGDLHGHTSYSDGQGVPADAFATAQASGLDFYGLTEHAFMLTDTEWQDVLNQANAFTTDNQFVALPGFEYTNLKGHINVFGSNTYVHRDDPNYSDLEDFYTWLINHPTAIGQFNHPYNGTDLNFNDFAYNGAADHKMILQELTTADQFLLSLNSGWHLGTVKNRDTHQPNWGCCPLMGAVAPNLTKAAILEALTAKRTFFVSPSDSNFALVMQANGSWMGSAIPNTNHINFTIAAYDPDPKGKPLRVFLYNNGVRVAGVTLPASSSYSWTPTLAAQLGHYYYAEAYYDGWLYPAYTSPIWVEQPPLANAGQNQTVATGAEVSLDGTGSYDPDGDPLVYKWTQESGTPVTLNQVNSARPAFTAPNTLGELVFSLSVVDTGSLHSAKTTSVTVTDQPILSISKNGPAQVEPGDPITYTLTVTNSGIAIATNVAITDALPVGATYVSGGTPMPGNVISWSIPTLPANGSTEQVSFVVTASGSIINANYRAFCHNCVAATGKIAVRTGNGKLYLPIISKTH